MPETNRLLSFGISSFLRFFYENSYRIYLYILSQPHEEDIWTGAQRHRAKKKERIIKFPFKRKGLTSHNVKFLKCLLENNNGQFKVDNKSTILHHF